jgi:hypothetical protein
VICDGYALDLAISLRGSGEGARSAAAQKRILRLLSPSPSCSFLLDVPAETEGTATTQSDALELARAQRYRMEADAFGARRIGAGLREELCEQIAKDVLRALERRTRMRSVIRPLRQLAALRSGTR